MPTDSPEYCEINQNEAFADKSEYEVIQHNPFEENIVNVPDSIKHRKLTADTITLTENPAYQNAR